MCVESNRLNPTANSNLKFPQRRVRHSTRRPSPCPPNHTQTRRLTHACLLPLLWPGPCSFSLTFTQALGHTRGHGPNLKMYLLGPAFPPCLRLEPSPSLSHARPLFRVLCMCTHPCSLGSPLPQLQAHTAPSPPPTRLPIPPQTAREGIDAHTPFRRSPVVVTSRVRQCGSSSRTWHSCAHWRTWGRH